MNAELTYTLELARVLKSCVERASTSQERVSSNLAFDRALKRGEEAIVAMLRKACEELAPIGQEGGPTSEAGEFIESLEYGEIPAPKATDLSGRNGTDRRRNNGDPIIEGARKYAAQNTSRKQRGRSLSEESRLTRRDKPVANGKSSPEATRDSVPLVPSSEKSASIMAQWR